MQSDKRPVKQAPSMAGNQLWLQPETLSWDLWIMVNYLYPLIIIICFPTVTSKTLELLLPKTSVGDYRFKYMAIIIPTNGRRAQSKGRFYRVQNCTSNPETSQILWPGHFTLCSVVYGFNGRWLPAFMATVADFNSGNMLLTPTS